MRVRRAPQRPWRARRRPSPPRPARPARLPTRLKPHPGKGALAQAPPELGPAAWRWRYHGEERAPFEGQGRSREAASAAHRGSPRAALFADAGPCGPARLHAGGARVYGGHGRGQGRQLARGCARGRGLERGCRQGSRRCRAGGWRLLQGAHAAGYRLLLLGEG
jgi:hypothetical protein